MIIVVAQVDAGVCLQPIVRCTKTTTADQVVENRSGDGVAQQAGSAFLRHKTTENWVFLSRNHPG
jgi:hypothetical protein